ncbi:brain and acute leukemia cytoplasmic protein [Tiliqua scincoides]|uniref:brain and acute leukemia cytoplasmic protein n=1 Tax=Tiliqua scincoides TaxID=71010 RepID=UPI0034634953
MGCGGSRADAIEPRYYESWTRETESTWLTNTDCESPQEGAEPGAARDPPGECGARGGGILEDSKSTQTCVTKSSAANEITSSEKRIHCGTQCTKPSVHTSGTLSQKQQNGLRTEAKWDSKKKSTKDITINAAKTIRQIKSNRRLTKNSVN